MPVFAAIGAGLAAIGGGSAVAGALTVGTAALGAGATLIGAHEASSAARAAGQTVANADQAALDLQRQIYDQNRADAAPFRDVGLSAARALAGSYGLPISGTTPPTMTGAASPPAAYSTAPAGGGYGGYYAPSVPPPPAGSPAPAPSMTGASTPPQAPAQGGGPVQTSAMRTEGPSGTATAMAGPPTAGAMTGAPPSNEVPFYDWNPQHTTGVLIRGATPEQAARTNGIVPSYVAGLSGPNMTGQPYGTPGSGAGLLDVIGSGSAYGWDPIQAQDNRNYLDSDPTTGFTRDFTDPNVLASYGVDPYSQQAFELSGGVWGPQAQRAGQSAPAGPPGAMTGAVGGTAAAPGAPAPAAGGQPDWSAYLQAYPDVAAGYQTEMANPQQAQALAAMGITTPEQFAADHWQRFGQNEGRTLPTTQATPTMTGAPGGGGGAPVQPGYTDPTAPYGYTAGPRPAPGVEPAAYVSGADPAYITPNFGTDAYHQSPGYNFQVSEALKAINNQASAGGRLLSGQRLKAITQRAGSLADQDYTDWRNFTAGQANNQNAYNRASFESDRSFGYGQARDARGDYVNDRTRADGLYNDDRTFDAGRYDARNQSLLTLAGFGPQANSQTGSAAQNFATNAGNLMTNSANATANAGIGSANAFNTALNNLGTGAFYLAGRVGSGSGSTAGGNYFGGNAGIAPANFSFPGATF